MGIVILTLVAAAAIFFGVWALAMKKAQDAERAAARIADLKDAEKAQAERDLASLKEPGASLYCLGCGTRFEGPLTGDGCPECRLSTLVVLAGNHNPAQNEQ
jgi:hypothetical protein